MRRVHVLALTTGSFAALAIAALATPAAAQTEDPQAEAQQAPAPGAGAAPEEGTIVVTGSRIRAAQFRYRRAGDHHRFRAASRIAASRRSARRSTSSPRSASPARPPVGAAQGGSFGSGQSFVNFLGLGDQRTLILVNGHRFVSSNTASIFGPSNAGLQVDLNGINTRLVDRVETIAIGGAPIYGPTPSPAPSTSSCGAIIRASSSTANTASPSKATRRTTGSAASGA